jgi:trans-2-enoyl-CoA reductase
MSKVRAIVFHQYGAPGEVVRVEDVEIAPPGPGEARVRILAAPINPADLNVIEGKYPIRPELPGVPGVEGIGVVEQIGAHVEAVSVGDRVLLPHGVGTWREACVVEVRALRVVPPEIAPEQAAMLKINPATALRMLRDFTELQPGDWILQNAANSGVGRAVIQIAHAMGLRTVNIVRRKELIADLQAQGADLVLTEDEPWPALPSPTRLALNAVGGESALRLANALAPGGTLVTYGAMGRQPLRIPNGLLIFQDLRWRGFWVSQWYRQASPEDSAAMFVELFALARRGVLDVPVERIYPLEEAAAALAHAAQSSRAGKILFGAPEIVAQFSPA